MKLKGQRQSQNVEDLRIQDPIVRMQQKLNDSEAQLKKTQREKAMVSKTIGDLNRSYTPAPSKKQDRLKPSKRK